MFSLAIEGHCGELDVDQLSQLDGCMLVDSTTPPLPSIFSMLWTPCIPPPPYRLCMVLLHPLCFRDSAAPSVSCQVLCSNIILLHSSLLLSPVLLCTAIPHTFKLVCISSLQSCSCCVLLYLTLRSPRSSPQGFSWKLLMGAKSQFGSQTTAQVFEALLKQWQGIHISCISPLPTKQQ